VKVYGTNLCIDCRNYKAIKELRGFEADYCDITESTLNLKEFLVLRDSEPIFDDIKKNGGIGIPFFVNEDGRKTFDINEALEWLGQPPVRDEEIAEKRAVKCETCG